MSAPPTPKTVSWVTERIARREGFTIDPASATIDQPRLPEGYAVAHGAFFYGLPGDLTEVCVRAALQHLWFWHTALSLDTSGLFIGGWVDACSAQYMLAVTTVVRCPCEARERAERHHQRFVFSFELGRDVSLTELTSVRAA